MQARVRKNFQYLPAPSCKLCKWNFRTSLKCCLQHSYLLRTLFPRYLTIVSVCQYFFIEYPRFLEWRPSGIVSKIKKYTVSLSKLEFSTNSVEKETNCIFVKCQCQKRVCKRTDGINPRTYIILRTIEKIYFKSRWNKSH